MSAFKGAKIDQLRLCPRCQGMGSYNETDSGGGLNIVRTRQCENCDAEGMIYIGPPRVVPVPTKAPLAAAAALKAAGDALCAAGDFGEAAAKYDTALALDAEYVPALSNRSHVLLKLGRYTDAVADATRVLAQTAAQPMSKVHLKALLRRSSAHASAGDATAATNDLDALLLLQPGHPAATTARNALQPEATAAAAVEAAAAPPEVAAAPQETDMEAFD
ncbi:hypothetical protein M885DRAFT_306588 [Pelagophyceae sp. CCMP2097]|nr:hypothetical protein M885DRAFT_306588 [Pelagophyceae sp. CCMP2097]